MDSRRHLTPAELAERLGVSVRTLTDWRYRGIGPRFLKVGVHIRYRVADVLAWEQTRVRGGVAGCGPRTTPRRRRTGALRGSAESKAGDLASV